MLLGVLSTETPLAAQPTPHHEWPHMQPTLVGNHQVPKE